MRSELEEIRGGFLKKELRARNQETGVEADAEDAEVERSTDLADSAAHDDEGGRDGGEESRVVGIKSSPNIGLPDRRGRELINCRNGRGEGDREACGSPPG